MKLKYALFSVLCCWLVFQLSGCSALTATNVVTDMVKGKFGKTAAGKLESPNVAVAIVPGVKKDRLNRIKRLTFILRGGNKWQKEGEEQQCVTDILTDNLIIQMMQLGYDCLESQRLKRALKEQGIQWEDRLELDNLLIKAANASGIQAVIAANIKNSNSLIQNATLKLIDAESLDTLMFVSINYNKGKYPHIAAKTMAKVISSNLKAPIEKAQEPLNSKNEKAFPAQGLNSPPQAAPTASINSTQNTNIDLTDVKREAYNRELELAKERKKWLNWQEKLQAEFKKIKAIDHDTSVSIPSKIKSWQRFLKAYNPNNPHSSKDEELRGAAKDRIKFWEEFGQPESIPTPQKQLVTLRHSDRKMSSQNVGDMLFKYNFYSANWYVNKNYCNPEGSFNNQFIVGEKVIVDASTGLMWERFGSPYPMKYAKAKYWISLLNRNQYAGYNNWRLPTAEEGASLLRKKKNMSMLHINVKFSKNQPWIWTADTHTPRSVLDAKWTIDFFKGDVEIAYFHEGQYVRAVRTAR